MKKIVFVRHGRAEDQDPDISDFERSLTVKGKAISNIMAGRYKEKEKDPGLLITSPAFRALETAYIFALAFGIKPELVRIESDLYNKSDLNSFFRILKSLNEDINIITLFGHNPDFTQMADHLSVAGFEFMTKTSIACLSFKNMSWAEIKPDSGKTEYFLKPEKTL
jgi:phosphohistidine phosphatase